jgi:mono/diheme cytochrome c family protein
MHWKPIIFVVTVLVTVSVRADEKELIAKGKTLFLTKICFTCHQTDPAVPSPAGVALKAPTFIGEFWGKERAVALGFGGKVVKVKMDEKYFIESVKMPMAKVVKGALVPMPPPPPPITDEDIAALMAYVKSLSKPGKK